MMREPTGSLGAFGMGIELGAYCITCGMPGHERPWEELIADQLVVEDDALAFSIRGVCGYGSTFDYSG